MTRADIIDKQLSPLLAAIAAGIASRGETRYTVAKRTGLGRMLYNFLKTNQVGISVLERLYRDQGIGLIDVRTGRVLWNPLEDSAPPTADEPVRFSELVPTSPIQPADISPEQRTAFVRDVEQEMDRRGFTTPAEPVTCGADRVPEPE